MERMRLTDAENYFWRPIMPCADNARVVFIIECCTPKVDQVDMRRKQNPPELRTPRSQRTARRDIPIIGERLVCVTEEQDVLGLEVGVDEVEVVQEGDRAEQLPCEGLDVRAGKGDEAGGFEEVEDAEAEQRCYNADVPAPVEAVSELNAAVAVVGVSGLERLQDSKLDATSVTILLQTLASIPYDAGDVC